MKPVALVEHADTDTLPKLLRRNMQSFGNQIGMREKDRGIWQSYTWRQCHAHVRAFALGLAAAGFKRGDKLSVLGDNRARLYWAQLAARRWAACRCRSIRTRLRASWPMCSATPRCR